MPFDIFTLHVSVRTRTCTTERASQSRPGLGAPSLPPHCQRWSLESISILPLSVISNTEDICAVNKWCSLEPVWVLTPVCVPDTGRRIPRVQ